MNTLTSHAHEGHTHHSPPSTSNPASLKDPVCGMTVTEQSEHRFEHEGRPFYFCSAKCQGKFSANPQQYLATPAPVDPPQRSPGRFTRARCTPRFGRTIPEIALFAGWRLSP